MRCLGLIALSFIGLCDLALAEQLYRPGKTPVVIINGFDYGAYPFVNLVKFGSFTLAKLLSQGNLSADNYPINRPVQSQGGSFNIPAGFSKDQFNIFWSGTGRWQFLGQYAHVISGGASVIGCGGASCNINNNFTVDGSAPNVEFDFGMAITGAANSVTTPGICTVTITKNPYTNGQIVDVTGVGGAAGCNGNSFTVANRTSSSVDLMGSTWSGASYTSGGQAFRVISSDFDIRLMALNSGTWSNNSGLAVCRHGDYLNDNTCGNDGVAAHVFLPEFVASLKVLNPRAIRFLDSGPAVDSQTGSGWANRSRTTAITYGNPGIESWIPAFWTTTTCSGTATICGTNTYTAAAAPATPAQMADGEVFQGQFANGNLTTMPTLNVGGRGAFPIYISPITLQYATIGGSPTVGDIIKLKFTGNYVTGSPYIFSFAVSSSDAGSGGCKSASSASLDSLGCHITQALVADTTLSAANIVPQNAGNGALSFFYSPNAGSGTTFSYTQGTNTETFTFGTVPAGTFTAGSNWTFTFNAILKGWIAVKGGIDQRWPIETQVQLANLVGCGLWFDFPLLWSDGSSLNGTGPSEDSITGFAHYTAANLVGDLYVSISNEIWNYTNPQTHQAYAIGAALDFSVAGKNYGRASDGLYGLLFRRWIGTKVTSAWASRISQLHRVVAGQGCCIGIGSQFQTSRLNGTDLITTGNAVYANIIGTNYNSSPNRPVDVADGLSGAPYFDGKIWGGCGTVCSPISGSTSNSVPCAAGGANTSDIGCLTRAADKYASGDYIDAFNWMDSDIRHGGGETLNDSILSSYIINLSALANDYPGHQLQVLDYEGGYQVSPAPATSNCTSLSISPTYCGAGGKFDNMLTGYKNSSMFFQLITDYYAEFIANSPAGSSPAWFTFGGGGNWGLFPQNIISPAPYQSYNATAKFNFLLKRDVAPRPNDNGPMWIERVFAKLKHLFRKAAACAVEALRTTTGRCHPRAA
jgi:hypothetical protein